RLPRIRRLRGNLSALKTRQRHGRFLAQRRKTPRRGLDQLTRRGKTIAAAVSLLEALAELLRDDVPSPIPPRVRGGDIYLDGQLVTLACVAEVYLPDYLGLALDQWTGLRLHLREDALDP